MEKYYICTVAFRHAEGVIARTVRLWEMYVHYSRKGPHWALPTCPRGSCSPVPGVSGHVTSVCHHLYHPPLRSFRPSGHTNMVRIQAIRTEWTTANTGTSLNFVFRVLCRKRRIAK